MSSGRVEKATVVTRFFTAGVVMAGTGNWGWVSARAVTGGTGVNGLTNM